jgi:hypothetical protein
VDRTAIHPHPSIPQSSTGPRTGEAQAIRKMRTWSAGPTGRETGGLIRATFTLARPVAAITVWAQSSDGFDVLTYRHFTVTRPSRNWDVTLPDLPAGAYDVIVDVSDPQRGTQTSVSLQVEV